MKITFRAPSLLVDKNMLFLILFFFNCVVKNFTIWMAVSQRQNSFPPLLVASQHLRAACRKAEEGLFMRACSNRMRGNGFKLEEGSFRLDSRKKFLPVRVVRHGTGCPVRLWMPLPWRCSRPGWVGSEQPGLVGGVPAYSTGVGNGWP